MKGAERSEGPGAWKLFGGVLAAVSSFVTVATIAACVHGRLQLAAELLVGGILGMAVMLGLVWWRGGGK